MYDQLAATVPPMAITLLGTWWLSRVLRRLESAKIRALEEAKDRLEEDLLAALAVLATLRAERAAAAPEEDEDEPEEAEDEPEEAEVDVEPSFFDLPPELRTLRNLDLGTWVGVPAAAFFLDKDGTLSVLTDTVVDPPAGALFTVQFDDTPVVEELRLVLACTEQEVDEEAWAATVPVRPDLDGVRVWAVRFVPLGRPSAAPAPGSPPSDRRLTI